MPAKRSSRKPRPSSPRPSPAKATPPDLDVAAGAPVVPVPPVVTPPDLDGVTIAPVVPVVPVVATPPAPKAGPPAGGTRFTGAARSQRAGQGRRYAFRRS
ncbi:hypothetical protein ACH4OY_27855 [Micromonospora rubida]|uniref:Uncharacterized protein n=1 Tax=Micromonospora rubida TaxID=2697657 RepID=A0ABW7SRY6_9ACTN